MSREAGGGAVPTGRTGERLGLVREGARTRDGSRPRGRYSVAVNDCLSARQPACPQVAVEAHCQVKGCLRQRVRACSCVRRLRKFSMA